MQVSLIVYEIRSSTEQSHHCSSVVHGLLNAFHPRLVHRVFLLQEFQASLGPQVTELELKIGKACLPKTEAIFRCGKYYSSTIQLFCFLKQHVYTSHFYLRELTASILFDRYFHKDRLLSLSKLCNWWIFTIFTILMSLARYDKIYFYNYNNL